MSGTGTGQEPWSGERGGSSGRLREFVRVGGTRRSGDRPRAYCLAETAQLGHHSRKSDQNQTAGEGADTRDDERRAQRELIDGNAESDRGDTCRCNRDAQ